MPEENRVPHTPLSVIVLTKNEEQHIGRCLESVGWADEIVVVDSGSEDATCRLAAERGAVVHHQPWLGWSAQRNHAISLASNDWVFCLEADEVVTGDLARSIIRLTQSPMDPADGYYVDRRGDFLGVLLYNELRRSRREKFVRLFNRKSSSYNLDQLVHEEVLISGITIELNGVLLHWRGYMMDEYVSAFSRYASLEARQLDGEGVVAKWSDICLRPVGRFVWIFFYKRGYRLRTRGIMHAMLKATADFIRYAKLWELQNVKERIPHPADEIIATLGGIVTERQSLGDQPAPAETP
jgi:(heptosyl)LPS beta-1,4-glucosyltransferase